MKAILLFFILGWALIFNSNGQDLNANGANVVVIRDFKYLFHYHNFYISGQPTLEALQWLKTQGVKKIVNLRTEKENTEYAEFAYDEKMYCQNAGFEYYSIPVDGSKDYTPEKLDSFSSLINNDDITLIHCTLAIRATNFFMAYLIKNKGYPVNDAVKVGRSMNFVFPLEKLLGTDVTMDVIK